MYNIDCLKSEYPQHQEILLYFKTTPCPSLHPDMDSLNKNPGRQCFQPSCYHYHSNHEIRRPIFDDQTNSLAYDPVPCISLQEGFNCAEGIRCRFAHNQNEINYHPLYYKMEPCVNCTHQNNTRFCPFYHPDEANRTAVFENLFSVTNNSNNNNLNTGNGINNESQAQNQFNLDLFKVRPCIKKGNHNLKICDYYHHDKDRRRPTNIFTYVPPMCQYITRNAVCPSGDNCRYAHNKLEQLYHPERYKRKFCLHYPRNIYKCDYGGHCSFSHNESEIIIELIHNMKQDEYFYLYKYKTVFCPFIYEHDRNQCVYAHNPQDLRRDPNQHKYNAVQCFYWSQGQIFSYDEGGCPRQMDCENCHGWKELEYHPLYYKTKPCNNGKKCNKRDCPFFHTTSERRQTSQLTKSLFVLSSPGNISPQHKRSFNQEFSQSFEPESMMMMSSLDANPVKSASYYSPFKMNELESPKKPDAKQIRFGESPSGFNSLLSSNQFAEDDVATAASFKPRHQAGDSNNGQFYSISEGSMSSEKAKHELNRSPFSQPFDLWGSFQQGHEDRLEEFLTGVNKTKILRFNGKGKMENSFDSKESDERTKPETNPSLTDEQFKKAFVSNLEKRGLGHTVQYLINPMIDLKALRSFGPKDFNWFPHLSTEDKQKIARIIQDILEEDGLLCEVNTVNECDCQHNILSEEGCLCRNLGSFDKDRDQDLISNLTSQLDKLSH